MACKEVTSETVFETPREANPKRRPLEGGYQCEFVEKPKELQSECSICLSILCEPHTVDCCGYKFCRTCIKRVEEQNQPCPLCKIPFTSAPDRQLERQLKERAVYCTNKDKGCNWTGELRKLSQHLSLEPSLDSNLKMCDYQGEQCPYRSAGCTFKTSNSDLEVHLKQNVVHHATLAARKIGALDADNKVIMAELQTTKQTLREELLAMKQNCESMRVELETVKNKSQKKHTTLSVLILLLAFALVCLFVGYSYYQEQKQPVGLNLKTDTTTINKFKAVEAVLQNLNTSVDQLSNDVTTLDRFTNNVSGNIIKLTKRVSELEDIQTTGQTFRSRPISQQRATENKYTPLSTPAQASYLTLPVHLVLESFHEYRDNGSIWHSLPFHTSEGNKLILAVDLNGEDENGHRYTELSLKLLNKEDCIDGLSNFMVELSYNTTVIGQDLIFPKRETVDLTIMKPSRMEYIRDRSNLIIDHLQLKVAAASVPGNKLWLVLHTVFVTVPVFITVWIVIPLCKILLLVIDHFLAGAVVVLFVKHIFKNKSKTYPPMDCEQTTTGLTFIFLSIAGDLLIFYYSYIWIGYLVLLVPIPVFAISEALYNEKNKKKLTKDKDRKSSRKKQS